MHEFNLEELKKLYIPLPDSHKGQNGKLLIIGGSHLFHAASLWSLKVASRIVDMVFYSSVPENNQIVLEVKKEFRDGIVVPREKIEDYINEADCVLIGPGMVRAEHGMSNAKYPISNIQEISQIQDEGEQTYYLTKYLFEKHSQKKWVIDAGALQMMEPEWLRQLNGNVIVTPHKGEFERLFGHVILGIRQLAETPESLSLQGNQGDSGSSARMTEKNDEAALHVAEMAKKYNCIILLKGQEDIVCSPNKCIKVTGGNAGMTKGGTGDVLAGLVAALACKNDLFLAACAGSYINKRAGDELFKKVGYYFNSSDLAEEIPAIMAQLTRR